ncbi:MAG TPA: hypothetical protein VHL11_14490 [Phototrophicaceae bacterium]|jgi:hypothetical protein|nr:hypothetical protein [Phototrophicaceae bacterium]
MSERRERRSRYDRPRRLISWSALIIGILIGTGGGIFFAWNVAPAQEFDTGPWQLTDPDKANYVVAVMVSYAYDGDLTRTINALTSLRPEVNPIDYVAQVACNLARTGYVDSSSGLNAIRATMRFYQGQGRSGCADSLIPAEESNPATEEVVILPTNTLQPPPSKTPVPAGQVQPSETPAAIVVPTSESGTTFRVARLDPPFCDADFPGVIEVYVQDGSGAAIPGQPIRVKSTDGESTFFSGMKLERGLDYADFQMEAGKGYIVDMPGLSDPTTSPIVAETCETVDGRQSIESYRIVFRPAFN